MLRFTVILESCSNAVQFLLKDTCHHQPQVVQFQSIRHDFTLVKWPRSQLDSCWYYYYIFKCIIGLLELSCSNRTVVVHRHQSWVELLFTFLRRENAFRSLPIHCSEYYMQNMQCLRNKDLPSPSWEQQRATAIVILAKEISFTPQTSNSKRGFSSLMLMVLLESQMSTSRGSNITQVLQLKIVFSHFLLCLLIYLLTYLLFFSHKLHSNSILSSLHSTPPDLFLFRFTLEKEPTSQDIHHTQHNKLQ